MLERLSSIIHLRGKYLESIRQITRLTYKELLTKIVNIRKSFIGIPIYKGLNAYEYSPFQITADIPFKASLFEDAADLIIYSDPKSFEEADIILSEADRGGGPLAGAIGRKTDIPIVLANWHKEIPENLPDAIIVRTEVGFSGAGYIVVSGIKPGQKVILVDDILSTGGTAEGLIEAIENAGAIVIRAFFVGEKVNKEGRKNLNKRFPNLKITTLTRFISKLENKVTVNGD